MPGRILSWLPRSQRGVTRYVHSSQQQEERTKKCRRCYRALSLGGWPRPRGLRNSLRSDSPRPSSSVGWPPPGPIKAGFAPRFPLQPLSGPRVAAWGDALIIPRPDAEVLSYRAPTRYPENTVPVIPHLMRNPPDKQSGGWREEITCDNLLMIECLIKIFSYFCIWGEWF